jgi:hypothetical protein
MSSTEPFTNAPQADANVGFDAFEALRARLADIISAWQLPC